MSIYNFGKNAKREVYSLVNPVSKPWYAPWLTTVYTMAYGAGQVREDTLIQKSQAQAELC